MVLVELGLLVTPRPGAEPTAVRAALEAAGLAARLLPQRLSPTFLPVQGETEQVKAARALRRSGQFEDVREVQRGVETRQR